VIAGRTRRLLEAPILPTLLALAAPNMAEALARISFITLDAYFVGWLGPDALAGVALAFPLFILMQTMAAGGIGGGVSSAIARALGAGRQSDADALVIHGLAVGLVLAACFTAGMLAAGPVLYGAMGAAGSALGDAVAYSSIVFGGSAAVWAMNTLASVVRGTGNMLVPAAAIVVGEVVHVVLSPALIMGWGSLPRLGVRGAALAVVASYVAGSLVLTAYLASGRGLVGLRWPERRFRRELFADILRVGALSSVNTIQFQLTGVILAGLVGRYGTLVLAGYGVATRLEMAQIPVVFGFGTALVTMVGANIGAGQPERARRIAWTGAAIGGGIGAVVGFLAAGFAPLWMGLFTTEPAVAQAGITYLRIVGPSYAFFGMGLALFFASQGAGRIVWPFLAVTSRLFIVAVGGWLATDWFAAGAPALFAIVTASFVVVGVTVLGVVKTRIAW
jgi:putative MATE family efflux protein